MLATIGLTSLGLLALYITIKRSRIDFLAIFNVFFCIGYVLAPLHIIHGGIEYVGYSEWEAYREFGVGSPKSLLAIWLVYLLVVLGYIWIEQKPQHPVEDLHLKLPYGATKWGIIISIFITIPSIFIYASEYGGLINAFELASEIRSGEVENDGPLVFFKNFTRFSLAAFPFAFALTLYEDTRSMTTIILSIVSGVLAITVIGLYAARIPLVVIILTCYLAAVAYKGRYYIFPMLLIGVVGSLFITFSASIYDDGLGGFINKASDVEPLEMYNSIWKLFSHMYVSLETGISHPEQSNRYFVDWVYGFLHLIPQNLTGISVPETVAHLNSGLVSGSSRAEIIPGIVAFFWYSGTWGGIMVGAITYGIIGAFLARWLSAFDQDPVQYTLYYSIALIWSFQFVRAGDPRILFRGQFEWMVILLPVVLYTCYRYCNKFHPYIISYLTE